MKGSIKEQSRSILELLPLSCRGGAKLYPQNVPCINRVGYFKNRLLYKIHQKWLTMEKRSKSKVTCGSKPRDILEKLLC